jgi:hypothetical protein
MQPLAGSYSQLFVFIIFFCISNPAFCQTEIDKKKSVYFEIAGSGGLGSINYEKHFHKSKNIDYTWRAGFSLAPIDKNNGTGIVFPLMINSIYGKKNHKLEFGIGQGITITTKGHFFALALAIAGYRYQSESKKWFYRITYTPLISYLVDLHVQHWGGISIGYTLKSKSE